VDGDEIVYLEGVFMKVGGPAKPHSAGKAIEQLDPVRHPWNAGGTNGQDEPVEVDINASRPDPGDATGSTPI
jgi:hypothetical protein